MAIFPKISKIYEYCPIDTINPRWFKEIGMAIAIARDDVLAKNPKLTFKNFEQGDHDIKLYFNKKNTDQLEKVAYIQIRKLESYI